MKRDEREECEDIMEGVGSCVFRRVELDCTDGVSLDVGDGRIVDACEWPDRKERDREKRLPLLSLENGAVDGVADGDGVIGTMGSDDEPPSRVDHRRRRRCDPSMVGGRLIVCPSDVRGLEGSTSSDAAARAGADASKIGC